MISLTEGNLLESRADALVNTVNCVGVMGKGIALQFKKAFPENFKAYKQACDDGLVVPGRVFVFETGRADGPRFLINFPTKRHWRGKSKLDDIKTGLRDLVARIEDLGIRTIAVPPLGCGNGGLSWRVVEPEIRNAFSGVAIDVELYPPQSEPRGRARPNRTAKPKWTLPRALIVEAMHAYRVPDNTLTVLEAQKLAYFLQVAGEHKLRLRFQKHHRGPYADNLSHLFQVLDGHYIYGAIDRSPSTEIELAENAADEARAFIASHPDSRERLERVLKLIDGFESPYGMELLATVHWVAHDEHAPAVDPDAALSAVQAWSSGKKARFNEKHVRKAWRRLDTEGWISA